MNSEYLDKLVKKLKNDCEARFARKALNYYDGEQEEEMVKFLEAPNSFRKHWRKKGMSVRTRNIVKKIVDASGLLFTEQLPKFEIWVNGSVSDAASQSFADYFQAANGPEFFQNFDNMVRLVKSGAVLVQYDTERNQFYFDHLHVGTCLGRTDKVTREIIEIVYSTSDDDEYRYMSNDVIVDFSVTSTGVVITNQIPNGYGFIPIVLFHDTNTPRCGLWNNPPTDIVDLNEAYNAHLMDVEYAGSWQTVSTLFTTADLEPTEETFDSYDRLAARFHTNSDGTMAAAPATKSNDTVIGGPGQIVKANVRDGQSAVFQYVAPNADLNAITEIFNTWAKDFAADWSVRFGDTNAATSGFQLVVEEMPNLQLRKARQRMFEAGFKRLYATMARILGLEGELFTVFSDPALPTDPTQEETVWSRRIQEGRASRVDYFMVTQGLSEAEALAKVAKIDAFNANNPVSSTRRIVVNGQSTSNSN